MSPLELNVPVRVAEAARALVRNKFLADKAVAELGASMLAGDLHDGGYGPAQPWDFMHRVVPFMCQTQALGQGFQALVPTQNTLGCSWKWRARSLDEEVAKRLERTLADGDAYFKGAVNEASYFWVEPLGLLAPIEGKNRVDFMREKGVEFFPAQVTPKSYPEPQRLKLYRVTRNGYEQLWAVLDGRWLQRVDHPSWTVPMLEAYGVETCRWPREFPTESAVHLTLFQLPWESAPLCRPDAMDEGIIDLQAVAAKLDLDDEAVVASVLDLDGVKIDPRVWIASVAGAVVSVTTLGLMPDGWTDARLVAAMLFGGSIVLGVFPMLRPLVVKRGALKS